MPTTPALTYGQTQLQPARFPQFARMRNVNLVAGTYSRGQCIGQVTDTEADAVQTVTVSGTPTGGTFTLGVTPIAFGNPTTIVVPYNQTVAAAQTQFDAVYGPGNTIVSGTTLPGGSLIVKFVGALSAQPVAAFTKVANGLTGGTSPDYAIAQTTVGVGNTGNFGAYAHGNSDGTQVIKGVLMYACTVDANGNVTISSEWTGFTEKAVPMYYKGVFRTEELVGLPSSGNLAVDFPGARISIGDLTSGEIDF